MKVYLSKNDYKHVNKIGAWMERKSITDVNFSPNFTILEDENDLTWIECNDELHGTQVLYSLRELLGDQ